MRIENKKELLDLIGKKIPIWKDFVGIFSSLLMFKIICLLPY